MQIRHIATFVAIVDQGTLTGAADIVFKTQGAVSNDLRSLEREVGLTLIDRSGQRIALTKAGRALLPQARELLQRMEDVHTTMRRFKQGEIPSVRVGSQPSLATGLLNFLLEYQAKQPSTQISISTELPSSLLSGLQTGRLDVAVGEATTHDDIIGSDLGPEKVLVVVRANDPLAATTSPINANALRDRPYVGFIRALSSARLAERFFEALGYYPTPVIEVDDFRLMHHLIRKDVGYGIMPVSTLVSAGDLVGLPTTPNLERRCAVQVSAQRSLSPTIQEIAEFIARRWVFPTFPATRSDGAESSQ